MLLSVLACVLAYLVGSVLFGPLVARRSGIELREIGSGNPGATNVERALGSRLGLVVLVLDAAKGAVGVLFAAALRPAEPFVAALCGFCAVLGHCHPMGEPTGGGKGVSTALGVMLLLDPRAALVGVLGYAVARGASGYGSVGSLVGVGLASAIATFDSTSLGARVTIVGIALLVVVRHRDNLRRLANGVENR